MTHQTYSDSVPQPAPCGVSEPAQVPKFGCGGRFASGGQT